MAKRNKSALKANRQNIKRREHNRALRAKLRTGITKRCGIHGLRHAFATHLIESGADVPTVQRFLGHRSVSTTMRYFHLSQARLATIRSPLDLLDGPET